MKYFKSGDWQEVNELPDDTALLVRAVGLSYVKKVENALREQEIPYFMAAERKDDVSFYVEKEHRDDIEKLVKQYFVR